MDNGISDAIWTSNCWCLYGWKSYFEKKQMTFRDGAVCPYCDHEFDSDDLYNANLYEEDEHDVKCPNPLCKKEFVVNVVSTFHYESMSKEDREEFDF